MAEGVAIISSREQLLTGYRMAVQNAFDLLDSSQALFNKAPAVALAIAQIGQEELGKAYLILCAGTLPSASASLR